MGKTYKIAIVGCGGIAHSHMDGYNRLDNVEVIAAVDPSDAARRTYQGEYDIPKTYASIEDMLERESPDIVSVCTWHLLHPSLTIAAAKAGVPGVICEKPMAIGMAEADSMVDACDASGTKLVIGHQRRFTPGWERARAMIADGAIGTPIFARNRVAEGLANWGTHSIDGTRFALGDPMPVWLMGGVERKTDRHERDVAIEDACIGLLQFDNDVQLLIESDLERKGAAAGSFQIQGTEGMIDVKETELRLFNAETNGWRDIDLNLLEGQRAIGGETNAAQVKELIAWLEGGTEHRGSGRQARVTVEIMMAIYQSARSHSRVTFPLTEKTYPLDRMLEEGILPVEDEGKYDIRGFLRREGIDEERFAELWAEGKPHHSIMRELDKERQS
jgi:UDP-N-acetyl-2-amino-2-deoxyglucuronate dehydrogenase